MSLPLDLLMILALIGGVLLGYPAAFTIAGVAALFALIGAALGAFDMSLLGALGQRIFGVMTNPVLVAIPLFVLMGVTLEKSRIAETLLETMGRLFGRLRGGLGVSVLAVGALIAASTGIVGATVVAMGLIALPTMLRNGYDARLASGLVCASGTLGQIIPPSTLLIILADVMSNAYQQAQYEQGVFRVQTLSVGQLFAAALAPGLVLVGLYLVYLLIRAWLRPQDAPALTEGEPPTFGETLRAVLPPVLLIVAVLGAILGGVATPTEAAAVGALGATLMAGLRAGGPRGGPSALILGGAAALGALAVAAGAAPVRLQRSDAGLAEFMQGGVYAALSMVGILAIAVALRRLAREAVLKPILTSTMVVTSMIFATIIAASVFSLVLIGLGGEARIVRLIEDMPGGATGALAFTMLMIFVLGFFLDFVEIAVIVLPLIAPPLILLGHDPLWLGVLITINLQTSFLTPPFGFSLFYLRGAAPPEVSTDDIYRGVAPFVGLQIVGVLLVWAVPGLALWLPEAAF